MRECRRCGGELAADSDPRRQFCSQKCRQAAYQARQRGGEAAVADDGPNARALEAEVARLEEGGIAFKIAETTLESARTLARQVDARPGDSALWKAYKDIRQELRDQANAKADTDKLRELWREITGSDEGYWWTND